MLFTLFFLFRDGRRLYGAFYEALPIEDTHKAVIFDRLDHTMIAVVRGTLLTALAQDLAYWALGVPFPDFSARSALSSRSCPLEAPPWCGPSRRLSLLDRRRLERDRDDRMWEWLHWSDG